MIRHSMRRVVSVAARVALGAASFLLMCSCASSGAKGHGASGAVAADSHASSPIAAGTLEPPSLSADKPVDYAGLHNVVAYTDGLYSGSVPEGMAGFESLRQMGIKTIISVDGAHPEVDAAAASGMRYVHLPIGYNGMDRTRALELARAVKELPGPVYLHCHHGKHRSAGAAGMVAVTLNLASRESMLDRMKVSGTAPNYAGLYACVQNATPPTESEWLATSGEFPSHWKTSGMVQAMVEVDEIFEHLKLIETAGWDAPADHPDLVPAAEAGRLEDLFRTLHDDPDSRRHGAAFLTELEDAAKELKELEEGLLAFRAKDADAAVIARKRADLSGTFKQIGTSCKECHTVYRD